jgi:hypothetical protein
VSVREAIARGFDRADPLVRRRLRQKLEFLTKEPLDAHYRSLRSRYRVVIEPRGDE